jgi:hypothetical protein
MEMTGRSNYAMTSNRYQHVPNALQREAADRLGDLLSATRQAG